MLFQLLYTDMRHGLESKDRLQRARACWPRTRVALRVLQQTLLRSAPSEHLPRDVFEYQSQIHSNGWVRILSASVPDLQKTQLNVVISLKVGQHCVSPNARSVRISAEYASLHVPSIRINAVSQLAEPPLFHPRPNFPLFVAGYRYVGSIWHPASTR